MMPISRSRSLQLIAGIAGASLSRVPARAADVPLIKLGIIPIEATCLAYYAKENGYFDKAGLNVEIDVNTSTSAIAAAILDRQRGRRLFRPCRRSPRRTSKACPYTIIAADGRGARCASYRRTRTAGQLDAQNRQRFQRQDLRHVGIKTRLPNISLGHGSISTAAIHRR